jgi:chaperonin GroES
MKKSNKKKPALPAGRPVKKKAATKAPKHKGLGTPYGDRVLVKPTPQEEVTSFGIVLPGDSKEKPERGTVVAVGPGKKGDDGRTIPLSVKVGDVIMFSKYGYDEVKINGTEYYLIREDSITFIF